ncbi:malonyl-ACP O-methyltransferase BioC [Proteus hauseri]|uniref:Malonyl-[acyl-carrier protein] O-methyltransferase n=1 Tax=Proteus cibi TaxID=2050966 RepID=A0ABU6ECZ6_9GAMM|nr:MULTISPECIES: malonyl-ACP O-methyltransferase BioC [Proteus]EST59394.1 biotin synthesis protein BioC [Proteus hauseri ZMd44]MBG6030992.1 malonyl-ACP O-methyltransferase BioC [Proteus hauseri]MBS6210782.1 malonyl-ACP O-methyltransferase BioC [Proteus hauseri]MEB6856942.1 malonyl-ACP O-methyltransferase BioC [Proteus cibi]MEB7087064.1 malonyl-ACP O-methyltransferase BioC [Proteus cibi]
MLSSVKTDKQRIAQTFGKAAVHYDNHANIQRYSGNKLMDLARHDSGNIVLDAGCGTGYFSQKWKQQGKFVIALDLSHTMLQVAKQQQRADGYLQSDIEHCAMAPQSVDIVFSNLAMQWCDDLSGAIKTLMNTVNVKGALYFSTLATSTLQEVREAWQSLDQHPHVNPFLSLHEIEKACCGFHYQLSLETVTERYDSLQSLFASLKGVGANFVQGDRQKGLMTRQKFRALDHVWKKEFGKYLLTYQIIIGRVSHD